MSFDQNDYLQWYIPQLRKRNAVINLHASGVPALKLDEIEPATCDQWEMVRQFEDSLAAWLSISKQEICFTPGATGGTLLAILTLARPDDEPLVESLTYEPMRRQAERVGSMRRFSRRMEESWHIPLRKIEKQITDRTGLVMITEPANPSGTFCPREEMLTLAEIAARHNAFVLVNEVYRGFTDRASYHGEADNIVVVSSLTKLLGTYGLRLGWLSGTTETIRRLKTAHMNMSMPNQIAAAYGIGVLARADELKQRATDIAAAGREIVDNWVCSTPQVHWIKPMGPGFGCIALPEHVNNDIDFAESLQKESGVLTVPGSYFGAPGTVRISWLQCGDRLEQGLMLFANALGGHSF
ncbi:MAG: pyridoxal phosphate-dependent aminotransferase [Proteobacteria bacterium]|nr:pyridoxal phosphate-dependent aminotransferase [Pseudomonadota bacterium]